MIRSVVAYKVYVVFLPSKYQNGACAEENLFDSVSMILIYGKLMANFKHVGSFNAT